MTLNKEQIKNGFWYYRPKKKFPPAGISNPGGYDGKANLSIVGDQSIKNSYQQKKLVKEWCQFLPGLKKVNYLWVSFKVNTNLLNAICEMDWVEGIYLKHTSIDTIEPLLNLKNLKYLYLGSSPKIENIDCFYEMQQLEVLEVENIKKIRDLGPIGTIKGLEGLGIEGSMWTTQIVDTLLPLEKLANLKYLFLANLRSKDKTLLPLKQLQLLQNLSLALWWNKDEFRLLKESLPNLKYGTLLE